MPWAGLTEKIIPEQRHGEGCSLQGAIASTKAWCRSLTVWPSKIAEGVQGEESEAKSEPSVGWRKGRRRQGHSKCCKRFSAGNVWRHFGCYMAGRVKGEILGTFMTASLPQISSL